jgi:hypothetical protein
MNCFKFQKHQMAEFYKRHFENSGRWHMQLMSLKEGLRQSISTTQYVSIYASEQNTGTSVTEEGNIEVYQSGQPAAPQQADVDRGQESYRPQSLQVKCRLNVSQMTLQKALPHFIGLDSYSF